MLHISDSTDVVGTAVRCLQQQLFTAAAGDHLGRTVETARGELARLPAQDFRWVPYADEGCRRHWHKIQSLMTQWFRPDPVCCTHLQGGSREKYCTPA
jgi:hypothetical protein